MVDVSQEHAISRPSALQQDVFCNYIQGLLNYSLIILVKSFITENGYYSHKNEARTRTVASHFS